MSTPAEQIRAEIEQQGAISFKRFMEVALYCPLCGYYEKKEDTTGKHGNFFTSVSVGPLFGELLAFQFAEWMTHFESEHSKFQTEPVAFQLVEAGAHDGRLAKDILTWMQRQRPELFERTTYHIVEPSANRRGWQAKTLIEYETKVNWPTTLSQPKSSSLSAESESVFTIIFTNELLDAFPVHRLAWDAKRRTWLEWGVALEREQFVWRRLPLTTEAAQEVAGFSADALELLPDGFVAEVCPGATQWWREAAEALRNGKLLTFDYGLDAEEFLVPQRSNGTLRAYHRHQVSADLLALPGEQDLTAQVNFTAIRQAGEAAGLRTEAEVSQAKFLTEIASRAWREDSGFGAWDAGRTRQFQTLTHPNHLGRAFRMLLQTREIT